MTKRNRSHEQNQDETAALRSRLAETEETLQAIRQHLVDAFVVNHANGEQVMTLHEAEFPYRMMVESMNEGAVTLIPDGTIFYCNPRFGQMIDMDTDKLIGVKFRDLIPTAEQGAFDTILKEAGHDGARGEFKLQTSDGQCVPVQLSVYQLAAGDTTGISIIATDITERVQSEEKIRSLASELTRAEQDERQRISQMLHDDLQQRLFAIKAQLSFLKDFNLKDQSLPDMVLDLDQIQESLSEAITLTRNLSIDLSPIVLHGEGLTEAMTWLAFRMQEQYGLQVDLDVKENFAHLDNQMRLLLFHCVRELLFNIVKHSGTLQAKVTLERVDGNGRVTVSDQGKGFDFDAVMNDGQTAHGLLIIRDRLDLFGCRMQAIAKPGEGTQVSIEIPKERMST